LLYPESISISKSQICGYGGNELKAVIIKGSYHRDGFIALLTKNFVKGLTTNPNVEVQIIDLLDVNMKFCSGCLNCQKDKSRAIGECSIKDGTEHIMRDMLDSDLLVLASPIYVLGPTALMKRFIERCFCMEYKESMKPPRPRNPVKENKRGLYIISAWAPTEFWNVAGIDNYCNLVFTSTLKLFACNEIERIAAGRLGQKNNEAENAEKAYEVGVRLAKTG
jgi:hypothetical protein